MKPFSVLLGLLWLLCASGFAAESGVALRFLTERAPGNLGEVILTAGDQLSPPFSLSSDHLTDPVAAPSRKPVLRLRDKPLVLSEIVLPADGNSFVVLLIPDPKGGYRSIVMPSDDPGFKAGDIYFYNHADKQVLGYVGTSKFLLKPGEGKPLRPAGAREDTFYDVGFGVREESGDRVLRTVRWPVVSRSRSYVFFYLNPVKNRIDFRAVDEFVAMPPAPVPP